MRFGDFYKKGLFREVSVRRRVPVERAFIDCLAIVSRGHDTTTFDEFEKMMSNADADTRAVNRHFKTVLIGTFPHHSGARTITCSAQIASRNRSTRHFRGD